MKHACKKAPDHGSGALQSVAALLALLLVCGGCCSALYDKPEQPITDPAVALERMAETAGKVKSFEYLTRMSYYSDNGAQKGAVDIIGCRPDSFRFEVMTPTSDTVAVVVSDGEDFMSHERGKSVCHVGKACAENISRLLPVAFTGEQLFSLFAGGAPLIDAITDRSMGWDDCFGAYTVTLKRSSDDTTQTIWLSPDTFSALKVRVERAGKLLFEIVSSEHETTDDVKAPRLVKLVSPLRDTDLEVDVREAFFNEVGCDQPESPLFKPVCPPGTTRSTLPCRK